MGWEDDISVKTWREGEWETEGCIRVSVPGRGNLTHKAAESGACLEWSMDASVARAEETKRTVEGDEDSQ